ncbi:LysR family transcriptional regulator [Lactobacillus sp. ESL0791]|uniref:LysR family transcriptional regulator n=1 Tax=Lactobacillus sp. ESL0791 TaxID=2983234 RepID=UPI0023F935F3|nr:LysR family transcriptional regulator [Lactobacillus sp. ESL0791]MDF7639868.1 LysR family transcriptional regulator [Lactobacillus sp. ESL0791]
MKITQLQQVVAIARYGSFNKAAEHLYVSQSNLSQAIKELEGETNHKIFVRTGKGVELTTFGSEFLEHAKATCDQFQLTTEFYQNFSVMGPKKLKIASQYLRFTNLVFIQLLKRYQTEATKFYFLECSSSEIVQKVVDNNVDLGLLVLAKNQRKQLLSLFKLKGLTYHFLTNCSLQATVSANNPIFAQNLKSISLPEMQKYPLVMYEDSLVDFSTEFLEHDISEYAKLTVVNDRSTLHEILMQTNAYSVGIMTNAYDQVEYYAHLQAIPLQKTEDTFEIGWLQKENYQLSGMDQEYLKLLKSVTK